jgi:Tol biopolymer transport system component
MPDEAWSAHAQQTRASGARPRLAARRRPLRVGTWLLLAALCACGEAAPPPALEVAGSASDGLVFVRYEGGHEDLVRARLADGEVRVLLAGQGRRLRWPEWSPQGERLVFQARTPGFRSDALVLWDPRARREELLAAAPERDQQWPAWSEDGRWLAWAFRDAAGTAGLERLDVASRRTELLAVTGRDDFFFRPVFAPDGASLVAQRRGPDGRGSTLWLLAVGSAPRALTHEPARQDDKASFLRDGASLVHARRGAGGRRDVRMLRIDGAASRTLAGSPDADEHSARASPVRDEIVYVSDAGGRYEVLLQPLGEGGSRRLAGWPDRDVVLARWSPDGQRLALVATPAEPTRGPRTRPDPTRMRVAVVDRAGRVLLDVPGAMPAWMPPWPD